MLQATRKEKIQGNRLIGQRSLATHRRRMIRALIISNDLADVELCLQELKRAQFAISADVVHTPEEFLGALRRQRYDVVLGDSAMADWTGLQALALLQEQEPEIPFILVTRQLKTEMTDEYMRKGASDCVDKGQLVRLPLAVAIALERTSLMEEHSRVENELEVSKAHYHALLENPTYGICRFDVTGKFLDVNAALVAMLGYDSKQE